MLGALSGLGGVPVILLLLLLSQFERVTALVEVPAGSPEVQFCVTDRTLQAGVRCYYAEVRPPDLRDVAIYERGSYFTRRRLARGESEE